MPNAEDSRPSLKRQLFLKHSVRIDILDLCQRDPVWGGGITYIGLIRVGI